MFARTGKLACVVYFLLIALQMSPPAAGAPTDGTTALTALNLQVSILRGASPATTPEEARMLVQLTTTTKDYLLNTLRADDTNDVWRQVEVNLTDRFKKTDEAELNRLVDIFKNDPTGPAVEKETRRIIDTVVFQTIANDATLTKANDPSGKFQWRRRKLAEGPRDTTRMSMDDWRSADQAHEQYMSRREQFRNDHEADLNNHASARNKKVFSAVRQKFPGLHRNDFFNKKIAEELASTDRDTQVTQLEKRFTRIFQVQGDVVDTRLVRDLAQIHYLMTGWEMVNDKPRQAAVGALEELNQKITSTATGSMSAILKSKETEHGFQKIEPQPTGFLPRYDFLRTIQAGYLLNDPGAGIHHGALTHRIQWRAVISDYEANPNRYNYSPFEIFTRMGEHDAKLRDEISIGYEVPLDQELYTLEIWSQVFDMADRSSTKTLKDFTHPEDVRDVVSRSGELTSLQTALDKEYTDRRQAGQVLADEWLKQVSIWNSSPSSSTPFTPTGMVAFLSAPEPRQIIDDAGRSLPARPGTSATTRQWEEYNYALDTYFDHFYQQEKYSDQERSGNYDKAKVTALDGSEHELELLMPTEEKLATTADRTELERAERNHQRRIVPAIPEEMADNITDRGTDETHDVASATTERLDSNRRREDRASRPQAETDAAPPLPSALTESELSEDDLDRTHDIAVTVEDAAQHAAKDTLTESNDKNVDNEQKDEERSRSRARD
ncbi:hypothetical protein AB833_32470 [Chromatiales bacterium (ex Bugula neritina AB1)]|nr:hypothetical protein AB833_32470 [Chromatiales bacterium (ex Bugula neritina AB1)]